MKDSDISAIKIGSAAFTRKWWEERRSIFANGSGTGKALDLWQKHCTRQIKQMTTDQRMLAEETCNTLRSSLLVAKKKVGSKDKATVKACDTYIDLIDDYVNQLNQAGQKSGALFDAEQELADQLLEFIPKLQESTKQCLLIETFFEKKIGLYEKWAKEASGTAIDSETARERKKLIEEEELLISQEMKKFTKLNSGIINPWKELKTQITARGVEGSPKIKQALRKGNGAYDIYVDALGKGQDLGQDHLHLLRRLIDQFNGKQESTEQVVKALNKLKEQLTDSTFGCGSKITQQVDAINEIMMGLAPLSHALKAKTPISSDIREATLDLDTKARQTDAIAQANMRATLRLKSSVAAYAKSHGKASECKVLLTDLLKGVKKAEEDFSKHQKALDQVLKVIALVK